MHCLVGTFVASDESKFLKSTQLEDPDKSPLKIEAREFFPFKIIFPINKVRIYYCTSKAERDLWVSKLRSVLNYKCIYDHYTMGVDLGKGKFGHVKLATHKLTNETVAVKVIKKRDVPLQELELQRREIEVL